MRNTYIKHSRLFKNLILLIAAIGVVMVWRGVWGLLDHYLFPGNPLWSYILSIALGIIILLIDDGRLKELKH